MVKQLNPLPKEISSEVNYAAVKHKRKNRRSSLGRSGTSRAPKTKPASTESDIEAQAKQGTMLHMLDALSTPLQPLVPIASDLTSSVGKSIRAVAAVLFREEDGESSSETNKACVECHLSEDTPSTSERQDAEDAFRASGKYTHPALESGECSSDCDSMSGRTTDCSRRSHVDMSRASAASWSTSVDEIRACRDAIRDAALTPSCSLHGNVAEFYAKLEQTDPGLQDDARRNRVAAVLLRARLEQAAQGCDISVRHKATDSVQIKRKLAQGVATAYSDGSYTTPVKTPRKQLNFNCDSRAHVIGQVHKIVRQHAGKKGISNTDLANDPSLRKLLKGTKITSEQMAELRSSCASMEDQRCYERVFGKRNLANPQIGRQACLCITPVQVATALGN